MTVYSDSYIFGMSDYGVGILEDPSFCSYYYCAGVVVAFACASVTLTGNLIFDCDMANYC